MNKRVLLARSVVLCALATSGAPGAVYFLSSSTGNDTVAAANVSQAKPWKSLSKLGSLYLVGGDQVLLKRGDVWNDTLQIRRSQSSPTGTILISAYGSGSPPEIRGSLPISGTLKGTVRTGSVPTNLKVKHLFLNDIQIPVSRYPSGALGTSEGWLRIGGVQDSTTVTAPALTGMDWTGASIHLRTRQWTLETHRILSSIGGKLLLSEKLMYKNDTSRFYLTNHALAFNGGNGWYQSKDTLRWGDPTNTLAQVQASIRRIGIHLTTANDVSVKGLKITGTTEYGIYGSGSRVTIDSCIISNPGLVGIRLEGSYANIKNTSIRGATNSGIYNHSTYTTVSNNSVKKIALMDQLGPDGMGSTCCGGHGILVDAGNRTQISNNIVDSIGYNGITFTGKYSVIEYNNIQNFLMTTDDGGGIYTIGNFDDSANYGSVIRRNIVHGAVGAAAGWFTGQTTSYATQAIALDDKSHDVRVDSNVLYDCARGVGLHNTRRITVRGNTIFRNSAAQVGLTRDYIVNDPMYGNLIEKNLLVNNPSQGSVVKLNQTTQLEDLGTARDNYQCTDFKLYVRCIMNGKLLWERYRIQPTSSELGPETQKNGKFDSAQLGWSISPQGAALAKDTGLANCGSTGNNCLKILPPGKGSITTSLGRFRVNAGESWLLSFRAKGRKPGQLLNPVLRRARGDYATLGAIPTVTLDTTMLLYMFHVEAKASDSFCVVDFHGSDSTYFLDDVSFRTIPAQAITSLPGTEIFVNPTMRDSTVRISTDAWRDTSGGYVTSTTLSPFQGAVWFQMSKAAKRMVLQASSVLAKDVEPVRFVATHGMLKISGLRSPGVIVDASGRRLAYVTPDPSGNASLELRARGVVWLRSLGETIQLPMM